MSQPHDLANLIFRAPIGTVMRGGDVAVVDRPGWHQVMTPDVPIAAYNEVVLSAMDDGWTNRQVEAAIDAEFQRYGELGTDFKWCVGPPTRPTDMGARLRGRGCTSWRAVGMACDPTQLRLACDPDIEVIAVEDDDALEAFCTLTADVWDVAPPYRQRLRADFAWARRHAAGQYTFFLARVDGEWAGTAAMFRHPTFAYLIGGAVADDHRGRGVYKALVEARLAMLRSQGCALAVTQARAATSAPILGHLGMRRVYESEVYLCQPRRRQPLVAHPGHALVGARLPDDLDRLWGFARASHVPHMGAAFPSRSAWQAKLQQRWRAEPDGLWLLVDANGEVIGFMHTSSTAYTTSAGEPAGHIHELYVDAGSRGQEDRRHEAAFTLCHPFEFT